MSKIDPEYGTEQQLPGTEGEPELSPAEQAHQNLLAENQELINDLLREVGPAAIVPLQVRFLETRLNLVTELLFKVLGNHYRLPFAIEYETIVADLVREQISAARQQKLAL